MKLNNDSRCADSAASRLYRPAFLLCAVWIAMVIVAPLYAQDTPANPDVEPPQDALGIESNGFQIGDNTLFLPVICRGKEAEDSENINPAQPPIESPVLPSPVPFDPVTDPSPVDPPAPSEPVNTAPPVNTPTIGNGTLPDIHFASLQRWSDPATWGGSVPSAGQAVTIPADKQVLLDVSPPELASLTVHGALVFDERDINLSVGWIMVHGRFHVGQINAPYTHRAVITLTGAPNGDGPMNMGPRVFGSMHGGVIQMIGEVRTSWVRLNRTAQRGSRELILAQDPGWRTGERIVIASTDFDYEQAESFTISDVSGNRITLDGALRHMHWGEMMHYGGRPVDQRAEVALLSRNITVQGDLGSTQNEIGGHLMVMRNGAAHIQGVEFFRMGQRGRMGRYPIHFHLMGQTSTGSFVHGSSIHRSFNRCLTIHGSHNVQVRSNVAFDAPGHCYFLEDGIETGNVFEGNLGMSIHQPQNQHALLPTDTSFVGPAVFWITNPANIWRNNVAAGSRGTGFWIALPEHPTGPSATNNVWPRRTPLGIFDGNVAHSNHTDGMHLDRGPRPNGRAESTYYTPRVDPSKSNSEPAGAVFSNFIAYKNRAHGAWMRGEHHLLLNPTFADNAIGLTFASRDAVARGGVFVGETSNRGAGGPHGRSLPKPWIEDYFIRGFEFYDGLVGVEESHFTGFTHTSLRRASALAYFPFTSFPVSPFNYARGLSFNEDTQRLWMETRRTPADPRDKSEDGYRSASFRDVDGSVSGTAGRTIVVDNPFVLTNNCERRDSWNAHICDEEYRSLVINTQNPVHTSVTMRRNGHSHTLWGMNKSPGKHFRSLVMPNRDYEIIFDQSIPSYFRAVLQQSRGRWVHLKVQNYPSRPRVEHNGRSIDGAQNIDDMLNRDHSGFYYDNRSRTLHLKLRGRSAFETLIIRK